MEMFWFFWPRLHLRLQNSSILALLQLHLQKKPDQQDQSEVYI